MIGSANGVRIGITGLGVHVPARVVTNDDLAQYVDTTDEWISTRTGIKARHFVAEGENAATLAVEASKKALRHAGVDGGSVDLIICGTSTAPESMPSVACLVGEEIGAPGAGAMDLAAACAGFSYAASVASAMLRSGAAGRVLLIGSDAMSTIVDPDDRSTAVLFGDGAGAVVEACLVVDRDRPRRGLRAGRRRARRPRRARRSRSDTPLTRTSTDEGISMKIN